MVRLALLAGAAALLWQYRTELLRYIPAPDVLSSAHARYEAALRARGLDETELGRQWIAAAAAALEHPVAAPAAFTYAHEFATEEPRAQSWRFPARRGQRVVVSAEFASGRLFVDLLDEDGTTVVASATADDPPLSHEVNEEGAYVLRVQPEILRAGPYRITQAVEASLAFPVSNVDARRAHGPFGAPRDGGRRRHEGIDIFAPRGTPVVAAADGWITGSTTNRLGGNVVWLWSPTRGLALYYAHLDRHAVSRGDRVSTGDVVGYVGTTGNARGTPPHLHFGIYARGEGAIDPAPFVVDPPRPDAPRRSASRSDSR